MHLWSSAYAAVRPRRSSVRRAAPLAALMMLVGSPVIAAVATNAVATRSMTLATGCEHSSGSGTLSLAIDGTTRTVIVHTPTHGAGGVDLPLVLNLHGSASTALEQEEFSGMDAAANADGFIVAYPQGVIPDGAGFDWNVPGVPLVSGRPVPAKSPSDVKFLERLVGLLQAKYCVDPREVYATGFSGGAREVSQLACDDASLFAAVAPVSGLRHPTPCPATRAVPVIAFHGTADPIDPIAGDGQAYWTYSVKSAAADWGRQDGCARQSTSKPFRDVTLVTRSACSGGATVELYEIRGEGHEWPSGPTLPPTITSLLGPQSNALDANQLIWMFFQSHPLP